MRAHFCFTVTNQMHSDGRFLLGMNFQKSKSSSIAIVYFQKSGCKGNHQPPIDNCHTTTHRPCLHGPNQLSDNNIQNEITAKIVVWCDYFAVVLYMVVKKRRTTKSIKSKSPVNRKIYRTLCGERGFRTYPPISLKFNLLSLCQSLRGYNLGYKNNTFLSPFGCSLSA